MDFVSINTYVVLVVCGTILLGLEIIAPGGLLGTAGGLLVLLAITLGFSEEVFGPVGGVTSAVVLIGAGIGYMVLMYRYIPHSMLLRLFTLKTEIPTPPHEESSEGLAPGEVGTAQSDLRPSGIAIFDARRRDVIAEGRWVERGATVRVVKVEGNHVVVREAES